MLHRKDEIYWMEDSVALVVISFFNDGRGSDDVVGRRFAAGWLHGDTERKSLPLCGLAYGNEVVGLRPFPEELLDDRASAAELSDDNVEACAFGCGGGSAVGGVVAKPDGV